MSKFQIGDKVVLVDQDYGKEFFPDYNGEHLTVVDIEWGDEYSDDLLGTDADISAFASRFELASQLNAGENTSNSGENSPSNSDKGVEMCALQGREENDYLSAVDVENSWYESGELPPIGANIEYNLGAGPWYEATVKYVLDVLDGDEDEIVIACPHLGFEQLLTLNKHTKIRPIKTPEQIAAEERSAYCDRIYGVLCKAERKNNRSDMAELRCRSSFCRGGSGMTIEQQKATAQSVYEKLKVIDPYCVLAGGAPRDWYFGNECNDLDFYYVSTARTINACRNQLQKVFKCVEIKTLSEIHEGSSIGVREMSNLYRKMPSLIRVWQCNIGGMSVQFIQLAEMGSQFKVIDHMDVSICKIWADVNMNIRLTEAFKKTLVSKSMFLSEGYQWSDPHPQKMKQRFEGKFVCASSEDQVNSIILRKALSAVGEK